MTTKDYFEVSDRPPVAEYDHPLSSFQQDPRECGLGAEGAPTSNFKGETPTGGPLLGISCFVASRRGSEIQLPP